MKMNLKKIEINKDSPGIIFKQIRRFILNFLQTVILKRVIWVEIALISIGGLIGILVLFLFVFSEPDKNLKEGLVKDNKNVSISEDTMNEIIDWIDVRQTEMDSGKQSFIRVLGTVQ